MKTKKLISFLSLFLLFGVLSLPSNVKMNTFASNLSNKTIKDVDSDNQSNVISNYSKEGITNQLLYGFNKDVNISIQQDLDSSKDYDYPCLSKESNLSFCETLYRNGYYTRSEYNRLLLDIVKNRLFRNQYCLSPYINYLLEECDDESDDFKNEVKEELSIEGLFYGSDRQGNRSEIETTQGNFTIIHDSGTSIPSTIISQMFTYLESIRSYYAGYNFNYPITWSNDGTFRVYLVNDTYQNDPTIAGCTYETFQWNPTTCASHIYIYRILNQIELVNGNYIMTNQLKEVLAHEYFHAIQNAYNYRHSWFKEAAASFSVMPFCGTCETLSGYEKEPLKYTYSMEYSENDGYYFFYFPLTLYFDYGGMETIRTLYANYNQVEVRIAEDYFKVIVNNTLSYLGYEDNYNDVFRRMCLYIYNPSTWFTDIAPGTSNWTRTADNYTDNTHFRYVTLNAHNTFASSFPKQSAKFYYSPVPSNFAKEVTIYFSNVFCSLNIDLYRITTDGEHIIDFDVKIGIDNSITLSSTMMSNLSELGIIISNTGYDTVSTTLYVSSSSLLIESFGSNERTLEITGSLDAGESTTYPFSVITADTYVFQTFGVSDCYLSILLPNGYTIAYNDNGGYSNNSFISISLPTNIIFGLSIRFSDTTASGAYKILITRSTGVLATGYSSLTSYNSIKPLSYTTNPMSYAGTLTQGQMDMFRFISNHDADFDFNVEADDEIDTYLYVFDPTECTPSKEMIDYDDDSYNDWDGQLIRGIKANAEYLVMVCQKFPNINNSDRDYTLSITEVHNGPKVPTSMNYLRIIGVSQSNSSWTVSLYNPNPYFVKVEYNTKMCFSNDAQYFTNLYHLNGCHIEPYSFKSIVIDTNFLADYITISLEFYENTTFKRMITYANGLSNNTRSCSPQYYTI